MLPVMDFEPMEPASHDLSMRHQSLGGMGTPLGAMGTPATVRKTKKRKANKTRRDAQVVWEIMCAWLMICVALVVEPQAVYAVIASDRVQLAQAAFLSKKFFKIGIEHSFILFLR